MEEVRQLTLFGEDAGLPEIRRTREEVFEDYDGFVKKFMPKRTTDDCYTPAPVYEAVLAFARTLMDFGEPLRPFWPGSDYTAFAYPEGDAVVDNPPFSILGKIVRFYCAHRVPFLLFAPTLTLFSARNEDVCYIVCSCDVTYANGAKLATSFVTNMVPGTRIWVNAELSEAVSEAVSEAQKVPSKRKRGFVYPEHVVTAATLQRLAKHGQSLRIASSRCERISSLDCSARQLYGGGYIISDGAAAERAAAERAAAERAAAENLNLSDRERAIIKRLSLCD